MIVSISGTPGSGKSSVAKAVARALNLRHFSAGDFMRELALQKGVSLSDLSRRAESDISIDREIDERTKHLALSDGFVIDSRLAFHFIPASIKIFLKVKPEVAASRIWGDIIKQKRLVESEFKSEKDVLDGLLRRMKSESLRYKKYYSLDCYDESNYDLVVDSSELSIDDCVSKVVKFVNKK